MPEELQTENPTTTETPENNTPVETPSQEPSPPTTVSDDDPFSEPGIPFPEKTDISFSDFKDATLGIKKEPKAEKEPKVEDPVEETSEVKTVETSTTPTTPAKPKVQSRAEVLKALGIPEAEHDYFKGGEISNEKFNYLKKKFEDHNNTKKELETLKLKGSESNAQLFTHPQGYVLDPQYHRLSGAVNISSSIVNHWRDQLIKIEAGEKWNNLGVDKDKNVVIEDDALEPDVNAKKHVLEELRKSERYLSTYETQLNTLQSTHQGRYQADIGVIKQAEEKYFPGYDKEDHPTAKTQKAALELLPESVRGLPTTPLLVKTIANNLIFKVERDNLAKENATLKAEIEKLKGLKPGNTQQPTKAKFQTTSNGGSSSSDITFDMFGKRMAGLIK